MDPLELGLSDSASNQNLEVSLIFPAYNEAQKIGRAVSRATEALTALTDSFEIIIAEDGSTDKTKEIATRLSKEYNSVKYIHYDERLGRGEALRRAFTLSKGSIIIYMDVDLSTEVGFIEPLIDAIRNGWDLATGSRMLPESVTTRSYIRELTSRAYNMLIQILFNTSVKDHQCGFKAFKRASLYKILNKVEDSNWFWDTEVIVLMARNRFKIKEIPIVWTEGSRSKVKIFSDSIQMGAKAVSLWRRLSRTRGLS